MSISAPWEGATVAGAGAVVAAVVVLYCVAGEPFVGRWLHHRMEREVAALPSRRRRGYARQGALELALGVLAALLAMGLPGIGWRRLGLELPHPAGGTGLLVAALVVALLLLGLIVGSIALIWRLDRPVPVVGGDRVRVMVPACLAERVWFLGLAVAAGVCEELLYRGVLLALLGSLLPPLSPWLVVVLGAVAFGAAHAYQGPAGIVVATVLGALFGALFLATGSLPLVMLLHAALDARVGLLPLRALRSGDPAVVPA